MYYICKFSDSWILYDAVSQVSKPLSAGEVNLLKDLFSGLLSENRILLALQISSINPNKLLQIPMDANTTVAKAKSNGEVTHQKT